MTQPDKCRVHTPLPDRFADQTELRNWLSKAVRLEYSSIENLYKFPSNDLYDLLIAMNNRAKPTPQDGGADERR